jgi:hypothetical protein
MVMVRAQTGAIRLIHHSRPTRGGDLQMTSVTTGEPGLDGSSRVLLAPVHGTDDRRTIPREMFEKKPGVFIAKVEAQITLALLEGLLSPRPEHSVPYLSTT